MIQGSESPEELHARARGPKSPTFKPSTPNHPIDPVILSLSLDWFGYPGLELIGRGTWRQPDLYE